MHPDADPQWTRKAGKADALATDLLLTAIADHAALTKDRTGRHREWAESDRSATLLRAALARFKDADFDWRGRAPFRLASWDTDGADPWQAGADDHRP